MCPVHWSEVPKYIRKEVYTAWDNGRGNGSSRHREAIVRAVNAVNQAR